MSMGNKKILMMVENIYPNDPRVRKEAIALVEAGYDLSVISIRGKGQIAYEEINGVKVYRIPEITLFEKTKKRNSNPAEKLFGNLKSIAGYFIEYAYFTTAAFVTSLYILAKKGFDVVHMHNPPDTLSLIGGFYRLLGKKYVFDHHDLSPDLYMTRVSGKKDLIYNGLMLFEKLSCKFSNLIISTNESYRQIEIERHSVNPDKIVIVRNNPILSECTIQSKEKISPQAMDGKKRLLFIGVINPQDGIDVLLQALHYLACDIGEKNFICTIVGDGDALPAARQLSTELQMNEFVDFKGMVFDRNKIKEYLFLSDIGVEPAPNSAANEHSTFMKVMEVMAAGKPLVAFDLKETRYSAEGSAILVSPGDKAGFARAIKKLMDDAELRKEMGSRGLQRIHDKLNWDMAKGNLIEAYRYLGYPKQTVREDK